MLEQRAWQRMTFPVSLRGWNQQAHSQQGLEGEIERRVTDADTLQKLTRGVSQFEGEEGASSHQCPQTSNDII